MRMGWMGALAAGAAGVLVPAAFAAPESSSDASPDPLVELGRRLFMDPAVSRAGKFACAACHEPEHGFSDRRRFSVDENGPSRRHSQPVTDLGGRGFHWDGEFDTVGQLLRARLAPPAEALGQARQLHAAHFAAAELRGASPSRQAFASKMSELTPPYYGATTPSTAPVLPSVTARLSQEGLYEAAFEAAFGDASPTTDRIVTALEAYLGTLATGESPYDRFLGGEDDALSPAALRGLKLFEGRAGCATCHTTGVPGSGRRATLTDGDFHNTGVTFRNVEATFAAGVRVDGGLGTMSFVAGDLGRFKTPSLRDVARRAPYMHDGSFATLEDVVRYYGRGGTPNAGLHPAVRTLDLSDREVGELTAFLRSLSGAERAGVGPADPGWPRRLRVRVRDLAGRSVAGLEVTAVPCGDRIGKGPRPLPVRGRTSPMGLLELEFPPSTHVRLEADGFELGASRPVPDCAGEVEVAATPLDRVSVAVHYDPERFTPPAALVVEPVPAAPVPQAQAAPGDGRPVRFVRARSPERGVAVYVAEEPPRGTVVLGRVQLGEHDAGLREVDLSGGAAEPIDLRRPADPRPEEAAPPRPRDRRR